MKVEVTKKPKHTVELKITIPQKNVKDSYDKILKSVAKNAEIKGFRKGQAPINMVEEKSDISKVYGEVIDDLLRTYYPQALKENHVSPVSNPKVEIKEFDINKDLEFIATVATRPEIKLGNYKKELEKIYTRKTNDLKLLNQKRIKDGEEVHHHHVHLTADDVIEAITKSSNIEVSDLLLEDEADRMMSRLVNQAQTVGLSIEQYLKSQNKTAEQLREEYRIIAENSLIAEFAMSEMIEKEEIEISEQEINDIVNASGEESAKEALSDPTQKLYIKNILAKNKLIAHLITETEGTHEEPKKEAK